MSYAILRTKKLTSNGNISTSINHNLRKRECLNADPNLTYKNEYYNQASLEEINTMTDVFMVQKNNVKTFEVLLTASPEFFQKTSEKEIQEWKKENIKYLEDIYGKENVKNISFHRDERTPHIHAHILPIVTQEVTQRRTKEQIANGEVGTKKQVTMLSAKHYLGGKEKLRTLQDIYAQKMEKFGLQRGISGSKAKHEQVQAYYARVNAKEIQPVILEKPSRFGSINNYTQENQAKIDEVNRIAQAKTQELERQKSLIESQKKALTKLGKQYESIERKKARLETERKNIEVERQKNIDNAVRKAVQDAQKELSNQITAFEKEKASMANREAFCSKVALEATKKCIELENMTNRKLIESAKDLRKTDHSKNIYICLHAKNQGDIGKIIQDAKELGCTPQRIQEVVAHSGMQLKIEKPKTISRSF